MQRVGLGFEEISETAKPNVKFGSFNIWEADNPIYQPFSILSYDLICVHVWQGKRYIFSSIEWPIKP